MTLPRIRYLRPASFPGFRRTRDDARARFHDGISAWQRQLMFTRQFRLKLRRSRRRVSFCRAIFTASALWCNSVMGSGVGFHLVLRVPPTEAYRAGLNKRIDSVLVHGKSSALSWIFVGFGIPIARWALR